MLALQKKGSWMDFDSRGYLNIHVAFMKEKCLQMQYMWCKLYKNDSYWGKYNSNLENCSYCEGRKPYYILKLLLLYNYLFNLVLFQFSRIKKFITYYIRDITKRLVVITTLCSQSIKSSKKLEPLWKYGSYLVIFLRNCFYSSCVKIGKQYFAKKLLFHR